MDGVLLACTGMDVLAAGHLILKEDPTFEMEQVQRSNGSVGKSIEIKSAHMRRSGIDDPANWRLSVAIFRTFIRSVTVSIGL